VRAARRERVVSLAGRRDEQVRRRADRHDLAAEAVALDRVRIADAVAQRHRADAGSRARESNEPQHGDETGQRTDPHTTSSN
jgi:hypothetical protein